MAEQDLSRRAFLQKSALLGVAVGAAPILASCGGTAEEPAEEPAGEMAAGGELDCSDVSGLTEVEVQTREGLQYVEESQTPDQFCDNCMHWEAPEQEGQCGACTLVPGPINPRGWCLSWAAQT